MNGVEFPFLTALTLVPLLGGIVLIGLGSESRKLARGLALTAAVIALSLGVLTWLNFDSSLPDIQF
ncbi:MAG: NADH-quinone oxidoreductase subunit M, partial [Verrucomicrobia bacterium]|nr:NADH-quinone oxidoreductase subunit M [Verrucomicrobiota bacterium]